MMKTTSVDSIATYFKFAERKTDLTTEVRAGVTTFAVMAYIIFLNPSILAAGLKLDPLAVAAGTALVAGVMTIAMGVVANYPFALAAGLGINAIVAFTLPAKGLSPAGAMGVIVIEGVIITILVVVGLREAIMNAVPLVLKRSIGVGIGLFILFIGFANGGLIVAPAGGVPLVGLSFPTSPGQFVFLLGLLITLILFVLKIRAALLISIVVTSIVAFLVGVTKVPDPLVLTPSFGTLFQFDVGNVFAKLPVISAVLTIFAIMLSDFFDTMGTVTGVAAEAGLAREDGSVPDIGRVLLVDSVAAIAGGVAGVSSNTTYIESAAGVAEGGRTGLHVGRDRRPLPDRDRALAAGPARAVPGHGARPRRRRLPDVHAHQGRQRRRRRGRHPGAPDDDPDAAHLRHHGRHRRRVHLVGRHQARQGQGRRGPLAHVRREHRLRRLLRERLDPDRREVGFARGDRRSGAGAASRSAAA